MSEKKTFSIGELSQMSNLSTATINYYVKIGVLTPPKKINKTRAIYSETHIKILKTIKNLKEKKINLNGIKEIINNSDYSNVIDNKIKNETITINELIVDSNISQDIYEKLIDSRIIKLPKISDQGIPYHTLNDFALSQAVGAIINHGVNIEQILKNKDHSILSKSESINSGLLGSKPKARIDLVDKFSGFRQSKKFQLTAVVPTTSLCAIA